MSAFLNRLVSRRRRVLVVAAAIAVACLPGVARLRTDNSPEVFLLAGDPAVARYGALRAVFGSDRVARVGVVGAGLWTPAGVAWLRTVEERLERQPAVADVLGPWSTLGRPAEWPPAGAGLPGSGLPGALLGDSLARGTGIVGGANADGGIAASLLVTLGDRSAEGLAAIRVATGDAPPGVEVLLAGLPPLDEALDRSSAEVLELFFPLLIGLAAVLLAISFRPAPVPGARAGRALLAPHALAGVVVPLAFVGFCELLVLGVMGYAGVKLNLVLAILPPLLFVTSLATAIHLVTRFRDLELADGAPPSEAVLAAFADKGTAIFWATASSLTGFGSLVTSKVGPIRALGLWTAIGLAAMAAAAYTVLPALLAALPRPPRGGHGLVESAAGRVGSVIAGVAARHRGWVLAATLLLSFLAASGLPRLRSESNALTYLASDHPVRVANARLEALGIGTGAVDLVLTAPPGTFGNGAQLAQLSWLAELLRGEDGVLGVVGAGDLVDAALRQSPAGRAGPLLGINDLRATVLREMLTRPAPARALGRLLSPDEGTARLLVFTRTTGYDTLDPLLARLRAVAAEELPTVRAETGGLMPLLLSTQESLLSTLASSFGLTLAMVGATFFLLLRSPRLTLLALIPNVLPILLVFGSMGWLGVPLDLATVMVASTTLGLAVDDTIHTLAHYRELAPELGGHAAVVRSVAGNAAAYSITGVVLAAGFGVCALSRFSPISRFGALSAAAILVAVVADFLLMPALFGGGEPTVSAKPASPADAG